MKGRPLPFPALTGPGRRARWRRRAVRRVLSATFLVGAVLLVVATLRPANPPSTRVLVAARDVMAGASLVAADLETRSLPAAAAPPGALGGPAEAVGRVVATGLTAGEAVTRSRLVPPLPEEPGTAATHLLVADERALDLAPPGSRVTIYPATGGAALATGVRVLTVDPPVGPDGSGPGVLGRGPEGATGRGLVVALEAAAVRSVFTALRPEGGPPVVLVVPTPSSPP
ncbi:MAG TPA: SAF domain-containing protein [Dermatophilaceae bacterium]|nr:SAF domain-containing protein [Dermatophilaceae bacterium]